jgi:hypothetical protein
MVDKENGSSVEPTVAGPSDPGQEASPEATPTWFETSLDRTRRWIHDNPTTAVLLAAGAGLLVGRAVSRAMTPPPPPLPPPTRLERMRERAGSLAMHTRGQLEDFGEHVMGRAAQTRSSAQAAIGRAGESLSHVPAVGAELLSRIGDAVQQGVSRGVTQKVSEWMEQVQRRRSDGAR